MRFPLCVKDEELISIALFPIRTGPQSHFSITSFLLKNPLTILILMNGSLVISCLKLSFDAVAELVHILRKILTSEYGLWILNICSTHSFCIYILYLYL